MTRDPDLAAATADLRDVVASIRRYDEALVRAPGDGRLIREVQSLEMQRTDEVGKVKVRAERLNMPWRSLMLVVEKHAQLVKRMRRKPDERSLFIAVEAARDDAQIALTEAEGELRAAEVRARLARARATAADGALAYMRASHAPS